MYQLAIADLRHEWILSLCLVLSIAAVVSPLLILMGLKYGTISTLRDRLVQDPVYRELRPAMTKLYEKAWFEKYAGREGVAFLTPSILPISSVVRAVHPESGKEITMDVVSTAEGDALLLENGGVIPDDTQCVLTSEAAYRLGDIQPGDSVELRATRIRHGKREAGVEKLEVAAVLEPRAGTTERIYTGLQYLLDVENYKEGMGAPHRGWNGGARRPYLVFDGLVALLPEQMSPMEKSALAVNTGITVVSPMERDAISEKLGIEAPNGFYAYDLTTHNQRVLPATYDQLRKNKLRGKGAILLPYVKNIQLDIEGVGNIDVIGLSLSDKQLTRLGMPSLPWSGFDAESAFTAKGRMLLPRAQVDEATRRAIYISKDHSIEFPIRISGQAFGEQAIVPIELLATLRTSHERPVWFNRQLGDFELRRPGFRGFRMYARTIDDVEPLKRDLEEDGVEVITHADEIERIRTLDRGLTRIFWLVAVVGITGGIAVLLASLYAAVERKTRDLSLLRLMGMSRTSIIKFPLYQGIVISIIALVFAVAGYWLLSNVINMVFSADLDMGQKICTLPASVLVTTCLLTVAVAFMSSSFAAWRASNIDPAEGMREE